jgi:putative intracellular protease/amidase
MLSHNAWADLIAASSMVVVSLQAAYYAYEHAGSLLPDLGETIRKFAEAYGFVSGSTGAAWALKGGGQALANSNGQNNH